MMNTVCVDMCVCVCRAESLQCENYLLKASFYLANELDYAFSKKKRTHILTHIRWPLHEIEE